MRIYETVATHRLEDTALKLGYQLDIRVIEPHEDGRYFVTAIRDVTMKTAAPLGWTDEEAIETLRRGTWKYGRLHLL
jgi:hypothetical protein